MQNFTREIRGIPFFLLQEYLQEMGGKLIDENIVEAPGWSVQLTRLEPFRLGSLAVGQTRLDIQIEDHLVDGFFNRLSKKTLRAGA
jgi:hypothetical protein